MADILALPRRPTAVEAIAMDEGRLSIRRRASPALALLVGLGSA
jgi:hypothetical protein